MTMIKAMRRAMPIMVEGNSGMLGVGVASVGVGVEFGEELAVEAGEGDGLQRERMLDLEKVWGLQLNRS